MYVCMYVRECVYVCVYVNTNTMLNRRHEATFCCWKFPCVCAFAFIFAFVRVCVCVCVCGYVHECVRESAHTCVYLCRYIYMVTQTYTRTCVCLCHHSSTLTQTYTDNCTHLVRTSRANGAGPHMDESCLIHMPCANRLIHISTNLAQIAPDLIWTSHDSFICHVHTKTRILRKWRRSLYE